MSGPPGMFGPPGHIPGYHAPGTLTPIGAIYEVQRQQQARAAADREAQLGVIRFLLLTAE